MKWKSFMGYNLPTLDHWENTQTSLQKISHLLKNFQVKTINKKVLDLQHSVNLYSKGIKVDISNKGHIFYNFARERITFKSGNNLLFEYPTHGKSIKAIASELHEKFRNLGIEIPLEMHKYVDETPISIDNKLAKEIAKTYWKLYSALARVKAKIFGTTSPLVLWTHHFDLAFLYFMTEKTTTSDPSVAFGFAPSSEGISRPYAYIYAWDGTKYVDINEKRLFEKSTLWNKGWHGVVLSYDDILTFKDPIKQIESFYLKMFEHFKEIF